RLLCAGGSGFLGQHVIKHLHERDPRVREIRILDLVPFLKLLDYKETKPVRWFVGDVCDPRRVQQAFQGVDCVIHCAALVSYHFPPDLEQLSSVNVTGRENTLHGYIQSFTWLLALPQYPLVGGSRGNLKGGCSLKNSQI
ncbi:unnamed protein product, partial [Timema podura]|nr:unnamed protein product [Timema podura]